MFAPGSFTPPPPQATANKTAARAAANSDRHEGMGGDATEGLNPAAFAAETLSVNRDLTVVVADDDAVLRSLLVLNLEAEGMNVHEAQNGAQALQFALTHQPDLIVLDVMMPVHDGLKVLRALKDEPTTSAIPVVLLTARSAPEEIEEGWQAGADYYLTKPFHMDQLLEFIEEFRAA